MLLEPQLHWSSSVSGANVLFSFFTNNAKAEFITRVHSVIVFVVSKTKLLFFLPVLWDRKF